jgi:hypothetical protein
VGCEERRESVLEEWFLENDVWPMVIEPLLEIVRVKVIEMTLVQVDLGGGASEEGFAGGAWAAL